MSKRFSDLLRQKLAPVWDAQFQHPFVLGIGDGSLDATRFRTWLGQSYLFLIEFARVISLAAVRDIDLDTMKWMIGRANGVVQTEMLLQEAYAVELGLPTEDLARGVKLPTTLAYTNHLLRTASLGSYPELVASLLPSLVGHVEIGQRLSQNVEQTNSRYRRWVDYYSGPAAEDLARRARGLLDRLAANAGPEVLAQAENAFAVSTRYEWLFWEMCYRGETWPI